MELKNQIIARAMRFSHAVDTSGPPYKSGADIYRSRRIILQEIIVQVLFVLPPEYYFYTRAHVNGLLLIIRIIITRRCNFFLFFRLYSSYTTRTPQ